MTQFDLPSPPVVPVVSCTHYDREWRFSFPQSRLMLKKLMDHLLDLLVGHPEFLSYQLDGQGVILEDYLALCPEKAPLIRRLMKERRLFAGPWYSLPDMSLLDGESIVRNLLMGHKVVGKYGPVMKAGYTATGFGQVSQLPQIYRGFGLDTCFFYRGVDRSKMAKVFHWAGPDGSKVIAYTFTPEFGRMPLYHCITRQVLYQQPFYERPRPWDMGEGLFRIEDTRTRFDYYLQSNPWQTFDISLIEKETLRLIQREMQNSPIPTFLVLDGTDSTEPEPATPAILENMNKGQVNFQFRQSSLEDFCTILRENQKDLQTFQGEMRTPAFQGVQVNLFGDVLSARMDLKRMHSLAERQIFRWAEPFALIASRLGMEYPSQIFEDSIKTLLNCQAHDCIAGCAQDVVHQDNLYALRQVKETADALRMEALQFITSQIRMPDISKADVCLIVFNPSCFIRSEVVEGRVDWPYPETCGPLEVRDSRGNEMAGETLSILPDQPSLIHRPRDAAGILPGTRHFIRFVAQDIPPLGYKVFRVHPSAINTLVPPGKSQEGRIENDRFLLEMKDDGTLSMTDKKSGRVFQKLFQLEWEGDTGNAYCKVTEQGEDSRILTPRERPAISSIFAKFEQSLFAEYEPALPRRKPHRPHEKVTIRVRATLRKDSPWVQVQVELDNRAKDFRLRALFPSGINAKKSVSDGPFDCNFRPIHRPSRKGWFEKDYPNFPMRTFCAVADAKEGFALLGRGMPEYEALEKTPGTLALTLLRSCAASVPKLKRMDPSQEGLQCQGLHVLDFAILLFGGWPELPFLLNRAEEFNMPLLLAQAGKQPGKVLPLEWGFLNLPEPLQFSSLKKKVDNNSIVIRFWNPLESRVQAEINLAAFSAKQVWLCDLCERRKRTLSFDGEKVFLSVGKKKITTLEIR